VAQTLQVLLTCDLDDDDIEAIETVTFGYEGNNYVFELCAEHLEEFGHVIQGYIDAARPADAPRRTGAGAASVRGAGSRAEPGAVRAWARAAGHEVSDRGRIPAEISEAYDAAHRGGRK